MSLLISTIIEAQKEIVNGLFKITIEHSEGSKHEFINTVQKLASREDVDIVITTYRERHSPYQPEFGLAWYKHNEHDHSNLETQIPILVGAIVFDQTTESWEVHT